MIMFAEIHFACLSDWYDVLATSHDTLMGLYNRPFEGLHLLAAYHQIRLILVRYGGIITNLVRFWETSRKSS